MASIRPLSKELQAKAEAELSEKPDRIPQDIVAFKQWIDKTPHLKSRTDDQFLLNILRGCKFSLERAKEKVDNYYAMRGAFPECYGNRFINEEFLQYLRLGALVPVPQTDGPDGPRVLLFRFAWDPSKLELADVHRHQLTLYQILGIEDDNLMVSGGYVLIDFKEATFEHVVSCTPVVVKKIMSSFEQGHAFRVKGFHFINAPTWAGKLITGTKMVVSEKLKSRVSDFRHIVLIRIL